MDHLRSLVSLYADAHPGLKANSSVFEHIENTFLPQLLRVIKRDPTLFVEFDLFPGIRVAWSNTDESWLKFHMALVHSVLQGNPREKFSKLLEAVKGFLPGSGAGADEVMKILEDTETTSSLSEVFELVMSTRLVSLVGDILQSMNFEEFDLDDPEKLVDMMKNPQANPMLQRMMERAKALLDEKVKSGKLNPAEIQRDIETVRAKIQSLFGEYLKEALVGAGTPTGNTSADIISNHPDARRARMLARLQKKQKQKSDAKK